MNKNILVDELINNQLKDIPDEKKLLYKDFLRIAKNLNSSIFDEDFCSIWTGCAHTDKETKKISVHFYFRQKKLSLHKLLYVNFVGPLLENESIKFTCRNRGHCCNINHLIKVTKEDKQKATEKKIQKEQEELKRSFTIDFD